MFSSFFGGRHEPVEVSPYHGATMFYLRHILKNGEEIEVNKTFEVGWIKWRCASDVFYHKVSLKLKGKF